MFYMMLSLIIALAVNTLGMCKRLKEEADSVQSLQKDKAQNVDKMFDGLPHSGNSLNTGAFSVVPYGSSLGRKERVSQVWKATRKLPDLVQHVSLSQPGVEQVPAAVAPEAVAAAVSTADTVRSTGAVVVVDAGVSAAVAAVDSTVGSSAEECVPQNIIAAVLEPIQCEDDSIVQNFVVGLKQVQSHTKQNAAAPVDEVVADGQSEVQAEQKTTDIIGLMQSEAASFAEIRPLQSEAAVGPMFEPSEAATANRSEATAFLRLNQETDKNNGVLQLIDGYTTPEKKVDVQTVVTYAISTGTPSSWADSVEKEEEQAKIISHLDVTKVSEAKNKIEQIMQKPLYSGKTRGEKTIPRKAAADDSLFGKQSNTNLAPLVEFDDAGFDEAVYEFRKEWYRILARRSLSPKGRSSPKLISLRKKVTFIDIGDKKSTFSQDCDHSPGQIRQTNNIEHQESPTEDQGSKRHQHPPSSGQSRPRRNRGRNRYRREPTCC